jgi:hypothetical protein
VYSPRYIVADPHGQQIGGADTAAAAIRLEEEVGGMIVDTWADLADANELDAEDDEARADEYFDVP